MFSSMYIFKVTKFQRLTLLCLKVIENKSGRRVAVIKTQACFKWVFLGSRKSSYLSRPSLKRLWVKISYDSFKNVINVLSSIF